MNEFNRYTLKNAQKFVNNKSSKVMIHNYDNIIIECHNIGKIINHE